MDEKSDKTKYIIPIVTFLIGAITGSVLTLLLFPTQCPECNTQEKPKEELEIANDQQQEKEEEENKEVKSSTVEVKLEDQPIESETNVSLPISECSITVDIAGAVNEPGVYCFKDGSKIVDVVKRAEGFDKDVAYKYVSMKINLSELITDYQKIYIPFKEDVYCEIKNIQYVDNQESSSQQTEETNNTSDSTQTCINLNTATKDQLTTLSGVGESTAQKIIDARPFEKPEDILNVSGIGESTYDKFKDDICVY
jgi:competence protein ComEA